MIKYRAGNTGQFGCLFEAVESAASSNESVWEYLVDCGAPVEHRASDGQFVTLKGRECNCKACRKMFNGQGKDTLALCTV